MVQDGEQQLRSQLDDAIKKGDMLLAHANKKHEETKARLERTNAELVAERKGRAEEMKLASDMLRPLYAARLFGEKLPEPSLRSTLEWMRQLGPDSFSKYDECLGALQDPGKTLEEQRRLVEEHLRILLTQSNAVKGLDASLLDLLKNEGWQRWW